MYDTNNINCDDECENMNEDEEYENFNEQLGEDKEPSENNWKFYEWNKWTKYKQLNHTEIKKT